MSIVNQTTTSLQEFIIIGFPGFQDPDSKAIFFIALLTIYLAILSGNSLLITVFAINKELHTPMYILISSLAVTDILISSSTLPKILSVLISGTSMISVPACFIQMFSYHSMKSAESLLLGLMAHDRYLAISKPLHYFTIVNNSSVLRQIGCCWMCAFVTVMIVLSLAFRLPFCGPNVVIHYFCDHSTVLKLACCDTTINTYLGLATAMSVLTLPVIYILFSYTKIIKSVLKIKTTHGRQKAFSTCGTHLLVIAISFFVAAGVYISNRVRDTFSDVRILAALIQNVVPPLINPIIYCLRTEDIRKCFLKVLRRSGRLSERK
ncbi:O13C3 protein, partial [Polypterus senegalus]|nr:olfactory receptor 142-like [Polypterus senegalus]MBN3292923.1 O13C3 protein [Polypterus senegalus]